MSKSLSTGQDALARRAHLVPINLVKIVDYAASATWRLSDRAVSYDYEGTGAEDFLPWVKAFGALSPEMNHIPDPALAGQVGEWQLTLSNETFDGERIAETLGAETLEGASVEWAQVFADDSPASYPVDLSDWASTDKTVQFIGRIRRVGPITEESIGLECSAELPRMDWIYQNSGNESDADRGQRVAFAYGNVGFVKASSWLLANGTYLAEDLDDSETTIDVDDTTDLAAAPGQVRIGSELINYTGKSATQLTGCTRGVSPSSATTHSLGDIVVDSATTERYIAADNSPTAINSIKAQYANAPEGYFFEMTSSTHYTPYLADESTIQDKVLGIFDITPAQMILIASAKYGMPIAFWADISGTAAPYTYTYTVLDTCESATGWTRGELDNSIYHTGAGSIKFNTRFNGGEDATDTLAGWDTPGSWVLIAGGTGWIFEQNTSNYTSSPHSLRWVRDDVGDETTWRYKVALDSSIDMTDSALRFHIRLDSAAGYGLGIMNIKLVRTADGDGGTWNIDDETLEGHEGEGWFTVVMNISDLSSDTFGGDYTGIDEMQIWWTASDASSFADFSIDTFQVIPEINAAGTETHYKTFTSTDMNDADGFNFQRRIGNEAPDSIKFWVSSDTPSGSTPPANRGEFNVPLWGINRWREVDGRPTDVGSPNYAAIISYGVTIADTFVGEQGTYDDGYWFPYPPETSPYVWVDQIRKGVDTTSVYTVAGGAMIEHPADIFRHLVEEIALGTVDETSVAAAVTNLGSDKLAFDCRALGLTWYEIVSRMAYESRANVARRYTSTGVQWAFLTAGADYTFDAPTLSVSDWEPGGFALVGRAVDSDLLTRFVFYYAIDINLGTDSEAYTQLLRVSTAPRESNDVATKVATSALQAAEDAFGAYESQPINFVCIQDATTAIDVAGYIVHEIIRRAKMFAIRGVPWYDGEAYALELGDMRNVTPPWSSTAVKCRVIKIVKDATEQLELRLVEVE